MNTRPDNHLYSLHSSRSIVIVAMMVMVMMRRAFRTTCKPHQPCQHATQYTCRCSAGERTHSSSVPTARISATVARRGRAVERVLWHGDGGCGLIVASYYKVEQPQKRSERGERRKSRTLRTILSWSVRRLWVLRLRVVLPLRRRVPNRCAVSHGAAIPDRCAGIPALCAHPGGPVIAHAVSLLREVMSLRNCVAPCFFAVQIVQTFPSYHHQHIV